MEDTSVCKHQTFCETTTHTAVGLPVPRTHAFRPRAAHLLFVKHWRRLRMEGGRATTLYSSVPREAFRHSLLKQKTNKLTQCPRVCVFFPRSLIKRLSGQVIIYHVHPTQNQGAPRMRPKADITAAFPAQKQGPGRRHPQGCHRETSRICDGIT